MYAFLTDSSLINDVKAAVLSTRPISVFEESFFDDWGDLNSVKSAKSISKSVSINKNMQRKRMENFNNVSRSAVGIGLKKAYNGSRRHNRFSTIG